MDFYLFSFILQLSKTIYSWIHRGFLAVTAKVLRRKDKKPGTQEKRGRFNV